MAEQLFNSEDDVALVEILDRVLNKGVVITGDLTIAVADVDLMYCGIRLLLTSVENIEQIQHFKTARSTELGNE